MSKTSWHLPYDAYAAQQPRYELADAIDPPMLNTTIIAKAGFARSSVRVEVTVDRNEPYAIGELEDASIMAAVENLKSFIRGRLGERIRSFDVESADGDPTDDAIDYVVLVAVLENVPRGERHALRSELLAMIGGSSSRAVRERVAVTFR